MTKNMTKICGPSQQAAGAYNARAPHVELEAFVLLVPLRACISLVLLEACVAVHGLLLWIKHRYIKPGVVLCIGKAPEQLLQAGTASLDPGLPRNSV